jgi:hypothetical protein
VSVSELQKCSGRWLTRHVVMDESSLAVEASMIAESSATQRKLCNGEDGTGL